MHIVVTLNGTAGWPILLDYYRTNQHGERLAGAKLEEFKGVIDLREVPTRVDGEEVARSLHMAIATDPRMRITPEVPTLRRATPVRPEVINGVCCWWFAFGSYEVNGGQLKYRNRYEDWR